MGRAACACRVREGGHAGAAGDGERAEAGGVGAEGVHLRTEDAEVELAGALTGACTRQGGRPRDSSGYLPLAACHFQHSSRCRSADGVGGTFAGR